MVPQQLTIRNNKILMANELRCHLDAPETIGITTQPGLGPRHPWNVGVHLGGVLLGSLDIRNALETPTRSLLYVWHFICWSVHILSLLYRGSFVCQSRNLSTRCARQMLVIKVFTR